MISVAKCKNGICVQLPKNITCKVGDLIPCPNCCGFKYGFCAGTKSFEAKSVCPLDESKAGGAVKYSEEEVISHWGQAAITDSHSSNSDKHSVSDGNLPKPYISVGQSGDAHSFAAENKPADESPATTRPSSYGKPCRTQSGNTHDTDDVLAPEQSYEFFNISGKVFTDDMTIRSTNRSAQPLKNALWEIFTYWETNSVFKTEAATELQDAFIWLITSVCSQNFKKGDIDAILSNGEYGRSEKFFYLFYDIIYRRDPPKGFYWCDEDLSVAPLSAYFRAKEDFFVKYCNRYSQGEYFRSFYCKHKREISHYLGSEDEEKLFEDMTLVMAKNVGEIVLIDRFNDYKPISIGKTSEFIDGMQRPSALSNMWNMVRFLKEYRVSPLGVDRRTEQYPFVESVRGELQEDDSLYRVLNFSSSASYASEYDCYVTLLREYVKTFKPNEVMIGELRFTRSNFSEEIEEIVKGLCKSLFGQVSDDVFADYKSRAWLTKSIYDRNILPTFTLENKPHVDKLIQLISNPTLEQYFELFSDCVIRIHDRDLSVHQYIEELLNEDVYTVCGNFRRDEIVKAFFNFKIRNWSEANLNELLSKYQGQYNKFINA